MGTAHQKRRAIEPVGPYAPVRPHAAEEAEGMPMAVANDEGHTAEAHAATTQSLDAFSEDVARHNADPLIERVRQGVTASREENRKQEEPEGYSKASALGWKELSD